MQCGLCWMLSITACVLCDNWHAGSGCCQPCCTHPHCHAQTEQRHTRCHECLMYAPGTCRPRAGTNWLLWYVACAGAACSWRWRLEVQLEVQLEVEKKKKKAMDSTVWHAGVLTAAVAAVLQAC